MGYRCLLCCGVLFVLPVGAGCGVKSISKNTFLVERRALDGRDAHGAEAISDTNDVSVYLTNYKLDQLADGSEYGHTVHALTIHRRGWTNVLTVVAHSHPEAVFTNFATESAECVRAEVFIEGNPFGHIHVDLGADRLRFAQTPP
jgi:hypothetical protein